MVNYYYKRNFAILVAGGLFAGMLLSTASAKLSPERTTLNAEIAKAVSPDMASKIPADEDLISSQQDRISYLADYAYSEVPPYKKPADIVLDSLKDVPVGAPIEEIKQASDAFWLGLQFYEVHCEDRI